MRREKCTKEGSGSADVMISSLVAGGRQELEQQAELASVEPGSLP